MIFAIRKSGRHQTLVEFPNWDAFTAAWKDPTTGIGRQISRESTVQWVKNGREHEAGMYWVDDEIAYASPDNGV
jgi:hypothetical protein